MVINKLTYNKLWKKNTYRELPLRGHSLHCKFLETYRDLRFAVALFEACQSKECYFIFPFTFLAFFSCFSTKNLFLLFSFLF